MIKRFLEYIQKNGLIRQGETVCAGVSGGADSVCLLIMLDEIKDRLGFSLSAFHVDHNLRGEESRADRDYTVRLCEERGIPIRVFSYDISSLSEKWKKGTEETGRISIAREGALTDRLSSAELRDELMKLVKDPETRGFKWGIRRQKDAG